MNRVNLPVLLIFISIISSCGSKAPGNNYISYKYKAKPYIKKLNDPDELDRLARNTDGYKRWLDNPYSSNFKTCSDKIRCDISTKKVLKKETIEYLFHSHKEILACLAINPSLTKSQMKKISTSKKTVVRQYLLYNPSIEPEIFEKLYIDEDKKVRAEAKKQISKLPYIKKMMTEAEKNGIQSVLAKAKFPHEKIYLIENTNLSYNDLCELHKRPDLAKYIETSKSLKKILSKLRNIQSKFTEKDFILYAKSPIPEIRSAVVARWDFPPKLMDKFIEDRDFSEGLLKNKNTPLKVLLEIRRKKILPDSYICRHPVFADKNINLKGLSDEEMGAVEILHKELESEKRADFEKEMQKKLKFQRICHKIRHEFIGIFEGKERRGFKLNAPSYRNIYACFSDGKFLAVTNLYTKGKRTARYIRARKWNEKDKISVYTPVHVTQKVTGAGSWELRTLNGTSFFLEFTFAGKDKNKKAMEHVKSIKSGIPELYGGFKFKRNKAKLEAYKKLYTNYMETL